MMKTVIRNIVIAGAALLLIAQFVRPERSNPASDPALSILNDQHIPPEVAVLIKRSCFDCHSNESRWPWYSTITPLNFLIANDVNKARQRLNFSEWRKQKSIKIQGLLQMIDDQVSLKNMPLPRYLSLHPGAALSESDIKAISEWAASEQDRLSGLAEGERR